MWAHWLSCNVSSVYCLKHTSYSVVTACLLMLSFLDSIFFDSNFLTYFFVIFLFSWFHSHIEILIKFTVTNNYSVLNHALLRDFLFILILSIFCFLVEILIKFIIINHYSISCNIFRKDFLFTFSNFKSANFSSICIQHMKVNLMNLIDRNLISSVNQIQLKTDNQL